MQLKKLLSIDLAFADRRAWEHGHPYFPTKEFIKLCGEDDVDIIETLCALVRRVPDKDSLEAIGEAFTQFDGKRRALEMSGARVIECPSKPRPSTPGGFKHSDDQRLMIRTLALAMKLRPDYVLLVAADGDFAPMVEVLREEGIRTQIIASPNNTIAAELRRSAVKIIDLDEMLQRIPVSASAASS